MSIDYKERAKWWRIGGITLLSMLAITLTVVWLNVFGTDDDQKLGTSTIAFAVFGGFGAPLLFKARLYNRLAKENKHE